MARPYLVAVGVVLAHKCIVEPSVGLAWQGAGGVPRHVDARAIHGNAVGKIDVGGAELPGPEFRAAGVVLPHVGVRAAGASLAWKGRKRYVPNHVDVAIGNHRPRRILSWTRIKVAAELAEPVDVARTAGHNPVFQFFQMQSHGAAFHVDASGKSMCKGRSRLENPRRELIEEAQHDLDGSMEEVRSKRRFSSNRRSPA